jgi:transposase-like protein
MLAGLKSQAEIARQHKLKPELIARWKDIALEGLETLFQGEGQRGQDEARIAELERMVGRLTMELDVAKKASALLPSALRRDARSS